MTSIMDARLVSRDALTSDTTRFTFESIDVPFTGLAAGAHIDVHLCDDLRRSYSLTGWDESGKWLSVAVKAEPEGRGGSLAMHRLSVGEVLPIAGPRNNFPLTTGDAPVVLLGGGIGITPLYAMATTLRLRGVAFGVHYFVRTRDMAAFDDALRALGLGDRYRLHCDDVDDLPDFWQLLDDRPADTHYYVCGPEVMLNAVQKAREELDRGTVIFERFAAIPGQRNGLDEPFEVVLGSSGQAHTIPEDQSILQVLRAAGQDVDFSCIEGTCGTCILDVLEGDIDHRDSFLNDDEKEAGDCMCICVSRACGPRLVLDL